MADSVRQPPVLPIEIIINILIIRVKSYIQSGSVIGRVEILKLATVSHTIFATVCHTLTRERELLKSNRNQLIKTHESKCKAIRICGMYDHASIRHTALQLEPLAFACAECRKSEGAAIETHLTMDRIEKFRTSVKKIKTHLDDLNEIMARENPAIRREFDLRPDDSESDGED